MKNYGLFLDIMVDAFNAVCKTKFMTEDAVIISYRSLAKLLGVSVQTIFTWSQRGLFNAEELGKLGSGTIVRHDATSLALMTVCRWARLRRRMSPADSWGLLSKAKKLLLETHPSGVEAWVAITPQPKQPKPGRKLKKGYFQIFPAQRQQVDEMFEAMRQKSGDNDLANWLYGQLGGSNPANAEYYNLSQLVAIVKGNMMDGTVKEMPELETVQVKVAA